MPPLDSKSIVSALFLWIDLCYYKLHPGSHRILGGLSPSGITVFIRCPCLQTFPTLPAPSFVVNLYLQETGQFGTIFVPGSQFCFTLFKWVLPSVEWKDKSLHSTGSQKNLPPPTPREEVKVRNLGDCGEANAVTFACHYQIKEK